MVICSSLTCQACADGPADCCNGHGTPIDSPFSGPCSVPRLHTELTGGALSSSICILTLPYLPCAPYICVFSQWIVSMVFCASSAAQMLCVSRGRMLELGFSVNWLNVALRKHTKFRSLVVKLQTKSVGCCLLGVLPRALSYSCALLCYSQLEECQESSFLH